MGCLLSEPEYFLLTGGEDLAHAYRLCSCCDDDMNVNVVAIYDPVEKEVADIFMPWLVEEAATSMNNRAVAAAAVEKVVLQAIV